MNVVKIEQQENQTLDFSVPAFSKDGLSIWKNWAVVLHWLSLGSTLSRSTSFRSWPGADADWPVSSWGKARLRFWLVAPFEINAEDRGGRRGLQVPRSDSSALTSVA